MMYMIVTWKQLRIVRLTARIQTYTGKVVCKIFLILVLQSRNQLLCAASDRLCTKTKTSTNIYTFYSVPNVSRMLKFI